jgi:carbonic anhydrase/acetyltransferase-like protein (isoleucine patch superfamily)
LLVPIYALGDVEPDIDEAAFVHPDAVVIGRVRIGPEASVWPGAVLRGDHGRIEIGARTSVQDGTVVHCTHDWPTLIGAECVVGHNAHLEGCVVADRCLIGSGSIILNRARAAGVPATIKKTDVSGDWVEGAVQTYVASARRYRAELRRLEPRSR